MAVVIATDDRDSNDIVLGQIYTISTFCLPIFYVWKLFPKLAFGGWP